MAHKKKKIFFISTFFILILNCYSVVFATDRYQYNTSWDDEYLGIKNIEMIFNRFNVSDDDINNIYDDFVYSFSKIKELYTDVKLYDLFFYQNATQAYASSVAYTVSNGFSKNESLPYINLIPGTYSTNVNWTTDKNSTGTISQSSYFDYSGGLSTGRSSVRTELFNVSEVENEDYLLLDGKIATFSSTYSILYDNQKAYISNSLPGLLISENEYISTDVEPEPEPEILPDTIDSTYGYLWSPSASNVEINLDYKEQNQLIHGEHFIGSALQSTFVFYYYSGDEIISFNDYVTRNAYLSTDYGTWYDFYISPENLEYLPNNTDFYLNIYATLNDNTATVVKDFLAFHTVDNSGGGDTSGDVPDTEIQNSLNNIENKIPSSGDIQSVVSKETDKIINFMSGDANFENENISSGDIIGSIGYTPPDDPYANFWWELTEILNNALTGTNRTLTLQAINNTYTISIDDIGWNPPDVLRTFLTLLSTTVVCWVLIKYIKITIDKLSSGSIDEALAMNEECGIVDLF